jgi:hypothetical protein
MRLYKAIQKVYTEVMSTHPAVVFHQVHESPSLNLSSHNLYTPGETIASV